MTITDREILYRSPIHFTPLRSENLVDGEKLEKWVAQQYRNAGITPEQVDTGAVIITGETSRKENAGTVLQSLSHYAGEFVVATAGPDLESVLAAKGSGVFTDSEETGQTILHMDIGGGTANLALIRDGQLQRTGCLNVGGRLLRTDTNGKVLYLSPVLSGLTDCKVGDTTTPAQRRELARLLCSALEMAAGRIPETALLAKLSTGEAQTVWSPPTEPVTVSFSGGVADCVEKEIPEHQFGDLGPLLGQAIRESSLCRGAYRLGQETIGATVIGAGCYSTQLSGSTVFCKGVSFPKKNIPVLCFSREEQDREDLPQRIRNRLETVDNAEVFLSFPGYTSPDYRKISHLAEIIVSGMGERPFYLCTQADMAKALGQRMCLLRPNTPCLCLDRLHLTPDSYLDVGEPVGPCYPVVIKTLVLSHPM